MIEKRDIERLCRMDMTERCSNGAQGVRLTAQYPGRPASRDRAAWSSTLQAWERDLDADLRPFGACTVDGTLSYSGQTVEILVPLDEIDATVQHLQQDDVDVRLQEERRIDPGY